MTVAQFCSKNRVGSVKQISAKKGIEPEVYGDLIKKIMVSSKSSNSYKWVFVAGAGLLIVGGAVAAYFVLKRK